MHLLLPQRSAFRLLPPILSLSMLVYYCCKMKLLCSLRCHIIVEQTIFFIICLNDITISTFQHTRRYKIPSPPPTSQVLKDDFKGIKVNEFAHYRFIVISFPLITCQITACEGVGCSSRIHHPPHICI